RWPGPSAGRSLRDLQDGAAHLDPIAPAQGGGPVDRLAVEEGAVGGAQVLEEEAAVPAEEPGVELRDVRVVGQGDVAARGPAQGEFLAEGEGGAPMVGRVDDLEVAQATG